jgi:hypothetical protein
MDGMPCPLPATPIQTVIGSGVPKLPQMGPTQPTVAGVQRRTTWNPRPFFSSLSLFCWSSVAAGMAGDVGTNPAFDYQLTLSFSAST